MFDWVGDYWHYTTHAFIWRPHDDHVRLFHAFGWAFGAFGFVVTMALALAAALFVVLMVLSIPFAIAGQPKKTGTASPPD